MRTRPELHSVGPDGRAGSFEDNASRSRWTVAMAIVNTCWKYQLTGKELQETLPPGKRSDEATFSSSLINLDWWKANVGSRKYYYMNVIAVSQFTLWVRSNCVHEFLFESATVFQLWIHYWRFWYLKVCFNIAQLYDVSALLIHSVLVFI